MTRLTADQLNITQVEYDALIWVRDAIDPEIPDHDLPAWMRFDMSNWGYLSSNRALNEPRCGTACCIGGSMEMHMAGLTAKPADHVLTGHDVHDFEYAFENLTQSSTGSKALYNLFFSYPHDSELTSRPRAVEAIDRFLAGNTENPWKLPGIDDNDD
jgi:hypothetical protein